MNNLPLIPVIMAGGSGSRLWPLSRELYPKQFLCLDGDLSMLQTTIKRLQDIETTNPLVICNEQHRFVVAEQLRMIDQLKNNIILEPTGRNTAPAIALAALSALQKHPTEDPLILVLAADHVITDVESFSNSIRAALHLAESGKLITFGIIPKYAETGYGYIKKGAVVKASENNEEEFFAYEVAGFVEKPNKEVALQYLNDNNHFWNSGMFLFKASRYIEELKKFRPDILSVCEQSIFNAKNDLDFLRISKDDFSSCPSDSIDYAVMEKTQDAVVVPMDAGWSDVGSWLSLWEISKKDANGNVHHGDVISYQTKDNYVFSESALVATIGIKDIVVVQTKDAILVAPKDSVQDVKKIVDLLKNTGRHEHHIHREVYRPWGKYDSIDLGERYKVKKIIVKPGEGLSLRMHHHRSEHWIVVSGTARITLNNEIKLMIANESIYIPQGAIYSLENPGIIPLCLIEVSSGDYLGEDDIKRFKERYDHI